MTELLVIIFIIIRKNLYIFVGKISTHATVCGGLILQASMGAGSLGLLQDYAKHPLPGAIHAGGTASGGTDAPHQPFQATSGLCCVPHLCDCVFHRDEFGCQSMQSLFAGDFYIVRAYGKHLSAPRLKPTTLRPL